MVIAFATYLLTYLLSYYKPKATPRSEQKPVGTVEWSNCDGIFCVCVCQPPLLQLYACGDMQFGNRCASVQVRCVCVSLPRRTMTAWLTVTDFDDCRQLLATAAAAAIKSIVFVRRVSCERRRRRHAVVHVGHRPPARQLHALSLRSLVCLRMRARLVSRRPSWAVLIWRPNRVPSGLAAVVSIKWPRQSHHEMGATTLRGETKWEGDCAGRCVRWPCHQDHLLTTFNCLALARRGRLTPPPPPPPFFVVSIAVHLDFSHFFFTWLFQLVELTLLPENVLWTAVSLKTKYRNIFY